MNPQKTKATSAVSLSSKELSSVFQLTVLVLQPTALLFGSLSSTPFLAVRQAERQTE